MYRVTADPEKRLLRIHISGYNDPAQAEPMFKAMKEAVEKLNANGGGFNLLADLREAAHVVPSDIVESTTHFMQWLLENGMRKSANITHSALMKLQLSRLGGDPRYGYFTSEEEALAWLES